MHKTKLAKLTNSIRLSMAEHSPEILTAIGITGMITTTVLAVKATPKALRKIEAKKRKEHTGKLSVKDTVKVTWKCYVPATVTGVFSTACLIGANTANARRNAALATAYKLSETAFTEYREKVVDTIGEKKEQAIRESIAKDKIDKQPVSKADVFITNGGETLFYDPTSDRYFKGDLEQIRRVVNNLNERMINGMDFSVSLNEFYSEIGLRYTMVGDELGWNVSKWGQIKIDFHAQVADNGQPCLVLDFRNPPKRDYDRLT